MYTYHARLTLNVNKMYHIDYFYLNYNNTHAMLNAC
jgi:hypothetical protein